MKYAVHYIQSGQGCGYMIGCGERFHVLPQDVDTYEKALKWLQSERTDALSYYGINGLPTDEITVVIAIYELGARSWMTTSESVMRPIREQIEHQKSVELQERRRQQYEELKREFEK